MSWLDWGIFFLPLTAVVLVGIWCRRYVKSVVDFLAAGRVAGRYVLSVSSVTDGAMGLMILVGIVEAHYKTGFALAFWNQSRVPLSILLALAGFVSYRYREMKVLSFGQFVEMRYDKTLRIVAAVIRVTAEIMASMLGPALAARFFIYLFGLPGSFTLFGVEFSTYIAITTAVIIMALIIILFGGVLGLMVTDCIQGLILYPCMAIMVIFVLVHFSWFHEMAPVMMDRAAGESFLNPYDIGNLRDFNLFAFFVTLFAMVFHGASWMGGGSASAAKSAHEQKMAGILGRWAGGLFWMFSVLLAIMIVTFFNHADFADEAKMVRDDMSIKIIQEIIEDKSSHEDFRRAIAAVPVQKHRIGEDAPLSQKINLDTPHLETVDRIIKEKGLPRSKAQEFSTLFHQLMMPFSMRHLLPRGLLGLFALMMVLMMLSTDDTRIYCSGTTIAQDIIVPLLPKTPSQRQHLWIIRGSTVFVGVLFFLGSVLMRQMDYINLFITIVCSIWMGGCAPVMLGGLYCRYGNSCGAYCSLFSGMGISLGGIAIQRNWADLIYPWLEQHHLVEQTARILTAVSRPMNPLIVWEMSDKKCPVNAVEFYALAMIVSLICYVIGSLLTYKGPFNMEKMLHRGIYNVDHEEKPKTVWKLDTIIRNMVGITPQYTRFDRFISWFTFYYQFVLVFFLGFVCVVIWNAISPWKINCWSIYFLIFTLVIPGVLAFLCSFLFTIGGWRDLFQLFRDLRNRKDSDADDNGMVKKEEKQS